MVGRFDFDLVQFWWAVKEIWSDQVLPCQLKNNEGFRLFCVFFKPNYVVLVKYKEFLNQTFEANVFFLLRRLGGIGTSI